MATTRTDLGSVALGQLLTRNATLEGEKTPKQRCQEGGGFWDEKTQSCLMSPPITTPKTAEVTKTPAPITPGTVETFTNPENQRASGVTTPDGRTYLGLGPTDVNKIAAGEAQRVARPENSAVVGTAQNQVEQQQRTQQLVQMAQQGLLTQQELQTITGANPDMSQALGAGAVGVLPGAIGGAATGLLAGAGAAAIGGAGAGAAMGAGTPLSIALGGIGAVTGFLVAVRNNIKSQQSGEFAADQTALTKGSTFLRSLITDTNQNPSHAPENIELFYKTLNMIDAAHTKTFRDSQENLNQFLGLDGTPQLAKFETFDATVRAYYVNRFETALAMPDPNAILITTEDMESVESEEV